MKLPSKAISYSNSVLSKFVPILDIIVRGNISPNSLYILTKKQFTNIEEYIDTLDCLFALGIINMNEKSEVLYYVNGNPLRKISSTNNNI